MYECLQGFSYEESRDKHFEFCKNNEAVRIKMPEKGSFVEFNDVQKQFKVSFVICVDIEAILKPAKRQVKPLTKKESYTKEINQHIPSSFCVYSKFVYGGEDENSLKLY